SRTRLGQQSRPQAGLDRARSRGGGDREGFRQNGRPPGGGGKGRGADRRRRLRTRLPRRQAGAGPGGLTVTAGLSENAAPHLSPLARKDERQFPVRTSMDARQPSSILAMRSILVAPGVRSGTPAVMMIRSP